MSLPRRVEDKFIARQNVRATRLGGVVGVAGVGRSDAWLGSPLALANLYAFGRLAWNPNLTPDRLPMSGRGRPSAQIRWWCSTVDEHADAVLAGV